MSKPTEDLHPACFETHFHHTESWSDVPDEFAIITAFATTGEQWSDTENAAADDTLRHNLEQRDVWLRRLTGYSPTSGHEEPGWAEGARSLVNENTVLERGSDDSMTLFVAFL